MKVKLRIEKEIDIPDNLVISSFDKPNKEVLLKLLKEVKTQIQQYFSQDIVIRKPYSNRECECLYCNRTFKNTRALTMHKAKSHKLQKKKSNLYLSAHRVNSSQNEFIYIILEKKGSKKDSYQSIVKLKIKS
jgi:hypothetical protein